VALALLTIVSAWLFMHTVFALHYAHDFYMALSRNEENGGLDFPGTKHPTYPDFLYFSYIIGTSAQTADVNYQQAYASFKLISRCVVFWI
jgi:uncharacterized membrane protein